MKVFKSWYFAIFFLSCFVILSCLSSDKNKSNHLQDSHINEPKQKGVHVFGRMDSLSFQPLIQTNFEWITYVPWGSQRDYDSPSIRGVTSNDSLRVRRRDSIWQSKITLAHDAGLKIFLKPHIWIHGATEGKWRSDIFPTSEENWKTWSTAYRAFILHYAHLAEKHNIEMFCVGTEFTRLTMEKTEYWEKLISEVRAIYSGKLTYAANWYKEFENVTFWDQLDYIGIQAYFPLVKNKNPSVDEISNGWKKHLPILKRIHEKFNKKILFTEIGYKSMEESAIEPWKWVDYDSDLDQVPVSTETQANCYQAFFDTVWKNDWFAGAHIWQWRAEHYNAGGIKSLDFTPQNKPAENTIAKGFEKK